MKYQVFITPEDKATFIYENVAVEMTNTGRIIIKEGDFVVAIFSNQYSIINIKQ